MMQVVAGREVIKSDADDVIEALEEKIAQLKSGEIKANRFVLALTDASVDSFTHNVSYVGRVTELLGLNEVTRQFLLEDMGV